MSSGSNAQGIVSWLSFFGISTGRGSPESSTAEQVGDTTSKGAWERTGSDHEAIMLSEAKRS